MPTKVAAKAPRRARPAAARSAVSHKRSTPAKRTPTVPPSKLAWHRRLRGFAAVKPMMFVLGFAAVGLMVMSVSRAATSPITGTIINVNTKCLTNSNGSAANNNPILMYSCSGGASQTWTLPGDGTVRTQNMCLDVLHGSKKSGTAAVLYACNGGRTQQWTWSTSGGTTAVKNNGNKLCLDNRNGSATDGNTVQVATCNATADAQKWTMPQATTVTPTPPPPAPAPSPSPSGNPSGEAVPLGDLPGWKQTFVDDFTANAPTGSWATTDPSKVVYTGDHGGQWTEYPDGWSSTYTNGKPGYQPGQVLSVHDGVLDFYLHSVNGYPSGANPSPLITGSSQYQTYGRYVARIKSDTVSNYHAAWLLWPQDDANGGCAESDFPEADLDSTVTAFTHNATRCSDYSTQDAFPTSNRLDDGWHTYTQEWGPGFRKYYIDGNLIGTSTNRVWSQPERWQLQTEPGSNSGNTSGHLLVDWVAGYSYSP